MKLATVRAPEVTAKRSERPRDAGFKCNSPTGGPADTNITRWIEDRANRLLSNGVDRVARSRTNARVMRRLPIHMTMSDWT